MNHIHPRSFWVFLVTKGLLWGGFIVVVLATLAPPFLALRETTGIEGFVDTFILSPGFLLVFIFLLIPPWAYLFYRSYRYQLTEEAYRSEWGVIWKHYTAIPYERIQNVDISRGILDRLLGLSHLHIQTAGFGGTGMRGGGSEGSLPGILSTDAERLREELIKRARGARTTL